MNVSPLAQQNESPKIELILYSNGLGKFVQYVFLIKMAVDCSWVFNFLPQ